MDSHSISVTPPLGRAKGYSVGSGVSIAGDIAALDKRGKIRQWIEDINQIDSFHSRASMAGTEFNSVISSEDSRYGRLADSSTVIGSDIDLPPGKDTGGLDPLWDDDFDDDDDVFVEAALSALEKGRVAFTESDYTAADAYLREALVMIKELARKQQSVCDTWELRRMLGVCAFHVHSAADAEHALVSVLENAPKNAILNEEQRLHVSETAHLLAQIYVKLGKCDKAYRYCEYALRGRRKVLGKTNEKSYDSLALMARILELQNNPIRAEFFVGMIPEAERQAYLSKFVNLCRQGDNSAASMANEILPSDAVSSVSVHKAVPSGDDAVLSPALAPKIPQRSPSRGSMSAAKSTVSALRAEELARPVSALSRHNSAQSSDHGDAKTVSSASAPGSPPDLAAAFGSLPPPVAAAQEPPHHVSQLQPNKRKGIDRPENISSHSHKGSSAGGSLPAISEPASPSTFQEQLNMFPQPLRLSQQQRQAFISELPGDNHYTYSSNISNKATREKSRTPRLRDPPRSVPTDIEPPSRDAPTAEPANPLPALSDRDRLPSRAAQVASPVRTAIEYSNHPSINSPGSVDQHEQSQLDEQPLSLPESSINQTQDEGGFPPAASERPVQKSASAPGEIQIDHVSLPPAHHPEQAPPVYDEVMSQGPVQPTPVMPDAQRSDFQNSVWTPPIQAHPAEGHGNLPFMPPTNSFAAHPPAPPPPSMQYTERWAVQYVAPSASQPADRQSITSSSYAESTSTAQSHQPSYQTIPSVGTSLSQDNGKSRRKTSLLKVFRAHTAPSTTGTTTTARTTASTRKPSLAYSGVRLTRSDFDTIRNDSLSDGVIDFWQEYLELDHLNHSTKFHLMRPIRAALLQESSHDPASLKAALPDLAQSDNGTIHIFLPLQNPKKPSHRSLLLISPQDGLACHYDPRQPWNKKMAETLTMQIAAHLSKPLEFLDVGDVPQVLNEKDSGVFVCMFMQHLVLKLQNTHVSDKVNAGLECRVDGKTARKTMASIFKARA